MPIETRANSYWGGRSRALRQSAEIPSRNAAVRSRASSRTGLRVCPRRGIGDQLGVLELLDRRAQEVDVGERIRLARQQQDRAADVRPVGDPGLGPLGRAGRMERVAEQHERGVGRVRFRGGEAGDATPVRVAADRHVRGRRDHEMEGGQRILGLALGEIDGRRRSRHVLAAR